MSKAVVLIVALAAIAICIFTLASHNSESKQVAMGRPVAGVVAKKPSPVHRVVNCNSETEQALNKMGLTMKNSVGVKVTQDGNQ